MANFFDFFKPKGIKTSNSSVTRAFTVFDDNSSANNGIQALFNSQGEAQLKSISCFNTAETEVPRYANNNILQANYTQISNRLIGRNKSVKSRYTRIAKKIENRLEEIGYNSEFIQDCFYEMYLGSGEVYLYIEEVGDEVVLRCVPRYINKLENVKIFHDQYNRLQKIKIGELELDKGQFYVLYNTRVGQAFYSNLKLALPFIKLKNQLLDHNLGNAEAGLSFKTIFDFDPAQITGMDDKTKQTLLTNFDNIKKQVESKMKSKEKSIIFPFKLNSNSLQGNNAQNQTNFLLTYCDEQIQICCFSNGSMTGRDKTANRSVAEQDRDNFEATTVQYFTKKIEAVANTWLIPQLVENSEDFVFEFYREETDETLQQKESSRAILELITQPNFMAYLDSQELQISKDTIKKVMQDVHGIQIEDKDEGEINDSVQSIESTTPAAISVRVIKKNDGCVMALLEDDSIKQYLDQIENDDLYSDPDSLYINGKETNPHLTLLYGLDDTVTLDQVETQLTDCSIFSVSSITPKKLKVFDNPENPHDVLVVEIKKTANLLEANSLLRELPYENSYPDYTPHITLAYLKKGTAKKYLKSITLETETNFEIKDLVFSECNSKVEEVVSDLSLTETRAIDQNKLDRVYAKYKDIVNLSYSQLLAWSEGEYTKLASLDRSPINRNLELLSTKKDDWTNKHIAWANKTIAFVGRMKNGEQGENLKVDGKDIGWSARDISLMNWAYNPKQTTRTNSLNQDFSFVDEIRAKQEPKPNISYSKWSNRKDVFNLLQKYKKVLEKLYTEIGTEQETTIRAFTDVKFQQFMSSIEYTSLLDDISLKAVDEYNSVYKSNIIQPKTITDNNLKLTQLQYEGGSIQDFDSEGNPTTVEYKGIDNSIKNNIANVTEFTPGNISSLVKNSFESWKNNLIIPLFNKIMDTVAREDGKEYIGCLGKLDGLIRDHHANNSGYAWQLDSFPPDPKNKYYYLERNCRCSRFYGTKTELKEAGFKIYIK